MENWKKFIVEEAQNEIKEVVDPIIVKPKTRTEELKEILDNSFIDLDEEYTQPPVYLGVINKFTGDIARVCTPANISAITGKAKAKKSFVQSMFVASAVKNGEIYNTITANLPRDKQQVLLFDTEQSQYDVFRVADRIKRLTGTSAPNLGVFSLRGLPANEIIELVEYALTVFQSTGIIFIDQIADLAKSINSEEEAVEIVRWLELLTKERNIHICCVIHQNKGDNFASGWLGTQIMKKAETVISVEKEAQDKDVSHVIPALSRSREFEQFTIRINSDGLPYIIGEQEKEKYNDDF